METAAKTKRTRSPRAPYLRYVMTSASHELHAMMRQKRIILATGVTLVPVLIPLALAFLATGRYGNNGHDIFIHIIESLYLKAMSPLLALFFGSMLIGEDVELQTILYILARPVPRSAWVAGKFAAYMVLAAAILVTSILLTFFACSALGGLEANHEELRLLADYVGINLAALVVYGSLCTFLGALVRRPVVFGVVLMFGWQRFATIVPGVVDFLTIEKYIVAMLPPLPIERQTKVLKWFGIEFPKEEFVISNARASLTLLIVAVCLLIWTGYVVRRREYSSARAVGG